MNFIWSTAKRDLLRRWADPLGLAISLAIPLVIGTLMTLVSGGSDGPKPRAKVLVVDHDDSLLSGLVLRLFQQSGENTPFDGEAVEDEDQARARIAAGEASSLLVIPEDFGEALLREEPSELLLLQNPAERILPGIVEETVSVLVDGSFYIQRVFGEEIRDMVETTLDGEIRPDDVDIARFSVSINQAMERLEAYLFPPVIELVVEATEEEDDEPDHPIGMFFMPGILIMALFFIGQGLSEDVWTERENGTLRRTAQSPQALAAAMAGKAVGAATLMAAVSTLALVIAQLAFDFGWSQVPAAIVWSTATGVGAWGVMMLVQLFASSRRGGSVLSPTWCCSRY